MGMKFTPTLGERIKIGIMSFGPNPISDNYTDKDGQKLGNGVVQASYLLNRNRQKQLLESHGYKQVQNDYGLVKRSGAGLPIYQKSVDANGVTRNDLVPIGNVDSDDIYDEKTKEVRPSNWYGDTDKAVYLAGQHRSTLYYNPTDHKYYQKAWDVNDYGGKGGSTAGWTSLGLGQLLDKIGSLLQLLAAFKKLNLVSIIK